MRRIKHAVVRQERIGLEIYLRSIVTQTSGEVEIALAIRDPQLCDKLTGPVLAGVQVPVRLVSRRECDVM